MIFRECDILSFFESTLDLSYPEVILYAEQEAMKAQRMCLRGDADETVNLETCQDYADCMKKLIFFLRYGMRPSNVPEGIYLLFQEVCHSASVRQRSAVRCRSSSVLMV